MSENLCEFGTARVEERARKQRARWEEQVQDEIVHRVYVCQSRMYQLKHEVKYLEQKEHHLLEQRRLVRALYWRYVLQRKRNELLQLQEITPLGKS